MRKYLFFSFLFIASVALGATKVYDVGRYGLTNVAGVDNSPRIDELMSIIKSECSQDDEIIIKFKKGQYDFYSKGAVEREYYISNHDQDNPKKVGLAIEDINNLTIEGNGASFMFHGTMIPISLVNSNNCIFKNFSIDFANPHIAQVKIVENDSVKGITFEPAKWVKYSINADTVFETHGDKWSYQPMLGIAFEEKTKRLVYRTSDLSINTKGVMEIAPNRLLAPKWIDSRLIPGTVVAMRSWHRPTPAIFLYNDVNTSFDNVKVHYANGMGLLAQMCENITLNRFGVCLKGKNDPRYFTTQADATHFSGCKGKIISKNGLYEGMMDDAINVHGTYLKVIRRESDNTLICSYMHPQAWGFKWGEKGDEVQFINSETMEIIGGTNRIQEIAAYDKESTHGAKVFRITFENEVEKMVSQDIKCGVENLEWTPEVIFSGNTVRNNRARGSLFSTPKPTIVENNLFDHTSGTAILLCGDCNGWYETGACRNVIIRKNRFINAVTNMFQFTNAVISIYPEIPNLNDQKRYFHSGIVIENNVFDTFDIPLLYAKSVDGLIFRNNKVKHNHDYAPFHWNTKPIFLERVINATIE